MQCLRVLALRHTHAGMAVRHMKAAIFHGQRQNDQFGCGSFSCASEFFIILGNVGIAGLLLCFFPHRNVVLALIDLALCKLGFD
ncbi:hypothetical protein ZIOFF_027582 [Zingiber officinale]|uniref:Uncharacterized protein n=1 Tax=Zingiber officinale TaxID=94328 RepID=A0A8J5GK50_ZINOF|nr:hypothetical protein ZIOFF_027582 [Zingiber officinale]